MLASGHASFLAVAAAIRVLDPVLADQIAAGEVVERPASVVKELLENAVDAGATRVTVEIEEGGQRLIRVTDDGHGMSPPDAELCVTRHATSKLRTREDLFSIATLGFRGEALPAIASVSRLTISTRLRDAVEGTRVVVEGGAPPVTEPVGCAAGCIVEVRDLFHNVPARLKFLRSRATESGHVTDVCLRTALAHPEMQLTLLRDGRRGKEFLAAAGFAERVAAAFPGETLTEINAEAGPIRVEAVLGSPERARSGAVALHLLVNGRPVRDVSLARAVAFAYGSVLPPGRYPLGALHLHLPPEQVDVNVHPQKREVRFREGRQTFDALTRLLARELGTSAWGRPSHTPRDYWSERLGPAIKPPDGGDNRSGIADPGGSAATTALPAADPWQLGETGSAGAPTPSDPSPQTTLQPAGGFFANLRVLGQVRRMLLICEGPDSLYVIDQHAADERLRYHRLRTSYADGSVTTQRLLFPERVECSESEVALADAHREQLLGLGLDCTVLGDRTVAVHTVPALLQRAPPARLLHDVLAELSRSGERAFGDALDMVLATMACHAAIRAGDALSNEEATALLRSLDGIEDFGGHCPHGRPVVSRIGLDDLERRLGR